MDGIKLVYFKKGFLCVVFEFMECYLEVEFDFWGDWFLEMLCIFCLWVNGFLDNVVYK